MCVYRCHETGFGFGPGHRGDEFEVTTEGSRGLYRVCRPGHTKVEIGVGCRRSCEGQNLK